MSDEARKLSYRIDFNTNASQTETSIRSIVSSLKGLRNSSVNIDTDTSGVNSGIKSVIGSLTGVQAQASNVGNAFRSSFLEGINSGNSFSASIKAGVGGALSHISIKAGEFKNSIAQAASSVKDSFNHPIETIKSGLGGAIQSVKSKFTDMVKGANKVAESAEDFGNSAGNSSKNVMQLGDSAEISGGKFEKLGSVLRGAGTAILAVSAAAGAGAVALGKEVISAYADYEQLVGGVDTLFNKASATVQNYAANAFQTAGMSANSYMELVTSFSSSMIKSLGGDTAKAAELSNQAIIDMADNSNKMGTSLELIQNAYRGFSMQNYTMLDNLKLGYGGTQDEMQRLLDDAGKLANTKFDISSFADVTEAIHVIQTNMGITGTTAKEAAETISGSMAATKASVQNLVAGLGNADADLGTLVGNVLSNFGNVVNNVVPVIENIINAMPAVMESLIPAVGEILPKLLGIAESLFGEIIGMLVSLLPTVIPVIISTITNIAGTIIDNIPMLIDAIAQSLPLFAGAAVEIIAALASGIGTALPELIPTIVETIGFVIQTIIENMPLLLDAGMQLLMGLAQGFVEALPIFIEQVPILINQFIGFLGENLPIFLEQGGQIIMTLAEGILTALPMLVEQLPSIITSIVTFIAENLPLIVAQGVEIIIQLAGGIIQAIPSLVAQLPAIMAAIVEGIGALIGSIVECGKNIVQGLWNGIASMGTWIKEKVSGFFSGIVGGVKNLLGIRSPSRVFADIGDNMALGLGSGFEKTMGGVTKNIEKSVPTDIKLPKVIAPEIPKIPSPELAISDEITQLSVSDTTYKVNGIVEDITIPEVSDITYGIKPIIGKPNTHGFLGLSSDRNETQPIVGDLNPQATIETHENTYTQISNDPTKLDNTTPHNINFSPVINLNVSGSEIDDTIVDNIINSLYEVIRELFEQFKREDLEQMVLKNQYVT